MHIKIYVKNGGNVSPLHTEVEFTACSSRLSIWIRNTYLCIIKYLESIPEASMAFHEQNRQNELEKRRKKYCERWGEKMNFRTTTSFFIARSWADKFTMFSRARRTGSIEYILNFYFSARFRMLSSVQKGTTGYKGDEEVSLGQDLHFK